MARSIGMDVHRSFAQVAIVEDGLCRDEGRIGVKPEDLRAWAETLGRTMRSCWRPRRTATRSRRCCDPGSRRVVVSNPRKTRAIAEAKVKTDKVDARILAAAARRGLPGGDVGGGRPDPDAAPGRARRTHLVRQRTRLKNQIHAILSRNLVPTLPALRPVRPRWAAGGWPARPCPPTKQRSVEALLRQLDFHGEELACRRPRHRHRGARRPRRAPGS